MDNNKPCTEWNQYVLFEISRHHSILYKLEHNGVLKTKHGKIPNEQLNGLEFGVWYEIGIDNTLCRAKIEDQACLSEIGTEGMSREITRNNRNLADDGTSQKLTQKDVEDLKQQQTLGSIGSMEVVETLVNNSLSFETKTEYSQFKYLRKKHNKFDRIIRAVFPNSYVLADYLNKKTPHKTKYLRQDTLSQLILYSDPRQHSNILTVDETGGLISGSVLERLSGCGSLWTTCDKSQMKKMADQLNLDPKQVEIVQAVPLNALLSRVLPIPVQFDSLIIATTKYNPLELVKSLGDRVKMSGSIVIYHPFREILIPVYIHCKESADYVHVMMTESFMRKYQILPERTHPEMRMPGPSGYLLTMIRV